MPAARGADVKFSIRHERAAPHDRAEQFLRLADRFARRLVEHVDLGAVVHKIHPLAEHDRHRPAVHYALSLPDRVGGGDVARAGGLEGGGRAHRGVVEILLGLRDIDRLAVDEGGDIQSPPRQFEIPDGLARARLEVPDAAVARPEDERRLPAHVCQGRRAVGRIFGEFLRTVHPADLTGLRVEPEEAVGGPRRVAPAGHDGAGDHEILEHDRDVRAAAVGGEKPKLLVERTLPSRLACFGIDRCEHTTHTMGEDRVGRRIGDHGRPADPLGRHVGQVDVEDVLPELLAGGRVEAEHLLGLLLRAGLVPHERVELSAHDHRRGNASRLVVLPENVRAFFRIERRHQRRTTGGAVFLRTTPVGPLGGSGGTGCHTRSQQGQVT